MTIQEILKNVNYCLETGFTMYLSTKEDVQTVKNALEKQIPKKPDKIKEYNPNDYYCTVCKYYLGYACLQPKFCPNCGQAIDRSVKE